MTTPLHHEQLRIAELSQLFNNTTTSYKFYWFWALLEYAQQKKPTILFKDLVIRMVSLSWHTVVYYKLGFGSIDQLPEIMKRILAISDLNERSKQEEIEDYLHIRWSAKDNSEEENELIKAVKRLQNEVPYRSLSPFITGSYSKNRVIDTAQRYFGVAEKAPIYKINLKPSAAGNSLTVQPEWRIYLQQHYKILQDFCWWNLVEFLRRRNPSVPNIGVKIGTPYNPNRNMPNAKKFWNIVLQPELPPLHCLYTQQPLQAQWSMDHFVPWSFVLHDQLWNLSPQPSALNSGKNNRLPHRQYWQPFAQLQYQAVQRFIQQKPNDLTLLEDYDLLYKTSVGRLTQKQFTQELLNTIEPLMQQAQNLGFEGGWLAP